MEKLGFFLSQFVPSSSEKETRLAPNYCTGKKKKKKKPMIFALFKMTSIKSFQGLKITQKTIAIQ